MSALTSEAVLPRDLRRGLRLASPPPPSALPPRRRSWWARLWGRR